MKKCEVFSKTFYLCCQIILQKIFVFLKQICAIFASLPTVSWRFNKFKSGMQDLNDLEHKEHTSTQVNIEGFGMLAKTIIGVLKVE